MDIAFAASQARPRTGIARQPPRRTDRWAGHQAVLLEGADRSESGAGGGGGTGSPPALGGGSDGNGKKKEKRTRITGQVDAIDADFQMLIERERGLAGDLTAILNERRAFLQQHPLNLVVHLMFRQWAATYQAHMERREEGSEKSCAEAVREAIDWAHAHGYLAGARRILDPSFGDGGPLIHLLERVGIEKVELVLANDLTYKMSEEGERRIRERFPDHIEKFVFFNRNMESRESRPKFGVNRFDLALFSQTLPFLSMDGRVNAFQNLNDAVIPGGRIFAIEDFPPALTTGYSQAGMLIPPAVSHFFPVLPGVAADHAFRSSETFRLWLKQSFPVGPPHENPIPVGTGASVMCGIVWQVNKNSGQ